MTQEQKLALYRKNPENYGYHAGTLKQKAEKLSDRGYIIGKTGQMGTGFYFFGDLSDAKHMAEKIAAKKIGTLQVLAVDFTKFNLFRPENANEYYDNLVLVMNDYVKNLGLSDIDDPDVLNDLKDMADFYRYIGVDISDDDFVLIVENFIEDLTFKSSKSDEMLNTRILKKAGFQGVDVRNTELDNFAVGSIIFDSISPDCIVDVTQEK